ncbi:3-ketoacyl-ACP reductase [Rhodococcus rhodochrous]|nr:3-ketoacyl-ACP reductase [Rhodococcus rhodochrous]
MSQNRRRVVIVTGGSRGIGLAIAKAFMAGGDRVMIVARKEPELALALEGLKAGSTGEALSFVGNVGRAEDAQACMDAAIEAWGSVDVLVNNAAANPYFGPLIDIDLDRALKSAQINSFGMLTWTKSAHRAWMAEHGGAVLNISSIGAYRTDPGVGYYNAAKAGMVLMTQQLAMELGPNVRVNALAPGLVKTAFAEALWADREEEIADKLPLKRLGLPEDIANAAVFLCSDQASWITGSTLVVDGGALSTPLGMAG